jgi:hypothetical protein
MAIGRTLPRFLNTSEGWAQTEPDGWIELAVHQDLGSLEVGLQPLSQPSHPIHQR